MMWNDPKAGIITFDQWNEQFKQIPQTIKDSYRVLLGTTQEYSYLNEPRCFADLEGDERLKTLKYDNSLASIRLWSFLLSENTRLWKVRKAGKKIVGTMKDLGTMPVLAYAHPEIVAFYPDGAWWIPCIMQMSEGLLRVADSLGFGEEVCPSRAALSAFLTGNHFPRPDLLIGGVGSCCDDFSALMQRVEDTGIPTVWWELPYRRNPSSWEESVTLPNGYKVSKNLVDYMEQEFENVRQGIKDKLGLTITDDMVSESIKKANKLRGVVQKIRDLSFGTNPTPFPSLELQVCEMIVIHFCSDLYESLSVLEHVLETIEFRVRNGIGVLPDDNCRVVWVNPVADLRIMNVFEDLGGTLAGTEYLFRHALLQIPEDEPPMKALAKTALCDPMIGPANQRADVVIEDAKKYKAEGVIISGIPGASHCATEGAIIKDKVQKELGLPVLEITVPPVSDSNFGQMATRFEAFFEVIRRRR